MPYVGPPQHTAQQASTDTTLDPRHDLAGDPRREQEQDQVHTVQNLKLDLFEGAGNRKEQD